MGKESALCKVRDDSACEQNGEFRCFRVSLRQPQGQLCSPCRSSSFSLLQQQTSSHLVLWACPAAAVAPSSHRRTGSVAQPPQLVGRAVGLSRQGES